jgi:myo-inositol-1(or 4)-monophosphatase
MTIIINNKWRKEYIMDKGIVERRNIAVFAAKKAGRLLLAHFEKKVVVKTKGDRDYATEIDLKSEKMITDFIKSEFPHDNILAEENKYGVSDSPYKWIIDPIDGTHNYMYGIRDFGISIALAYKEKIVVGVIYMPIGDEMYVAVRGNGAYLNSKKIHVSKRPIRQATMVHDSSIRAFKKNMIKNLSVLSEKVFNLRMYGCSVRGLTYLAQGKVDVVVEYEEKIWDCAAGLLLAHEAGGKITDFQGKQWDIKTSSYIASNPVIHKEILNVLKHTKTW